MGKTWIDGRYEERETWNKKPLHFFFPLVQFFNLTSKTFNTFFYFFTHFIYFFFFFPFCINFFFEVLFPPSNVTLSTGGYCSQAEAEKILNQITKRTNRGLCKLMKNASTSNVIDLTQDFSSSEDEKFVFPCGYLPA